MTVVVTHTTPADGTFSATGAAAWDAAHALSGVGTMAEQDANNVAITGGAINNTTIGATTPSTGVFTTLTATGQTSLGGAAGAEGLRVLTTASAVQRILVKGQTSGGSGSYIGSASTTDTDVNLIIGAQNAGAIRFSTARASDGTLGADQMRISNTASAVNYVQVTGAATTASPIISAQGSDTNISFQLRSKGSGDINLMTSGGTNQVVIRNNSSAVNFISLSGSATGFAERIYAEGSDTNIPIAFQSKGTGAIDLAAGSSGVNISNGGTVTAITRTAGGISYTSVPTIALSAPTTAGGVQATASITISLNSIAAIVSGGTGYTAGDTLTVVGGTGTAVVLTVSTVSAGAVTAVTISNFGSYSVAPSNPMTVTGGTGTGATFTANFGVQPTINITNAGSGYVEQPTVTFSGGGGSGAAAYATVGGTTTIKTIGNTLDIFSPAGRSFQVLNSPNPNPVSFIQASPNSTGQPAYMAVGSSDTNASMWFFSKGIGSIDSWTGGGRQFLVANTASAVNYVQVTGSATGNSPTISAQGSDTNINLSLSPKGAAVVAVSSELRVATAATNFFQMYGSGTGFGPVFSAIGSDTNIPLVLQPKGTGALQAQQTDSTATGGNARGANAVDWQMSRGGAAQVASSSYSVISGGIQNTSSAYGTVICGGLANTSSGTLSFVGGGQLNQATRDNSVVVGGSTNTAVGIYNFIGGGFTNTGTANATVTTQSATMNGTTAVTLAASNASIKVGQYIAGTSIAGDTYVAAVSGTSLTLSKNASGSSTSTLSFYTPHGVVVGGGNNQATGAYSFIGGGGDAGTAANRNVASGAWSFVGGGAKNTASGAGSTVAGGGTDGLGNYFANTASGTTSFIGGGWNNTASGTLSAIVGGTSNNASGFDSFIGGGDNHTGSGLTSAIMGGRRGTTRGLTGYHAFPACYDPLGSTTGAAQGALLILARQTTDATATVLTCDGNAASTTNQVILPNNSAYYFKGTVIANVTGGGNTKGWTIEGAIKRGANAASTALVGTPTVVSAYADAGAATWAITATADTTNGGLAITFTGQAGTTIRVVAKLETTEVTF